MYCQLSEDTIFQGMVRKVTCAVDCQRECKSPAEGRAIAMSRRFTIMVLLVGVFFVKNPSVLAHVPHDVVVDLKLSPSFSRDKTIFAAVRGTLLRSVDGGYGWHRLSKGLCSHAPQSIAVSPAFADDKTLFVSCIAGEVYRSHDAGSTWVHAHNGLVHQNIADLALADLGHTSLALSPQFATDHTVLLLDDRGSIYRTSTKGENWEKVFHQSENITAVDWVQNLLMIGTDVGELYVSEDRGMHWKKIGQHPEKQKIKCIELPGGFSENKPFFIGTEKEGVFRVVHSGSAFYRATSGMPDKHITSLTSRYERGRLILFASTWSEGIFRSENAGTTWNTFGTGLQKSKQADFYRQPHFTHIAISDDMHFFTGGFCGIFRSDNRGKTWYKLETLLNLITGLDVSPPDKTGFTVGITTYGGGAYATNDGGISWKINNRGLINPRLGPLVYSPHYVKDKTVFSASLSYILKSTDKGEHWDARSVISPETSLQGVRNRILRVFSQSESLTLRKRLALLKFDIWSHAEVVAPLVLAISPRFSLDQTLFVGMYPSGVLRSQDGGSTFSLLWDTLDMTVRSLVISPHYAADQTLFVSLDNGLYKSDNGGESWEQVESAFDLRKCVLAISPQYGADHTLFAGGLSGLLRTRNGGETWDKLRIVNDALDMRIAGLAVSPFFATDRQLLVQVAGGDLFLCRDYGDRFEAVPSESADLGYEFSQIIRRESAPLMKFSPNYDKDKTVYAVSMHHLVKSTDEGKTWVEVSRPVRYESEAGSLKGFFSPITLEGKWEIHYGAAYSGGAVMYSHERESQASLRFVGSEVRWMGTCGPDRGLASVFIDGLFQRHVDQYSKNPKVLEELFSLHGLPYGSHTITITVDGARNEKSSGERVDIDAFDIRN